MNINDIIERDLRNNRAANTLHQPRKPEPRAPGKTETAIVWLLVLAALACLLYGAYTIGFKHGHARGLDFERELDTRIKNAHAAAEAAVARMTNPELLAGDRR